MSTKYELATELRALTRGMKALPICKMTKAQLETEIDRIKVMKQLKEDIPDYPPAKPGPLGPRPIPVATKAADDDLLISVPQAPPKHTTAPKPRTMKMKVGETVHFEDPGLFPSVSAAASARALPTKALPSRSGSASTESKFSHPGAPKRSHTCNCPMCPERATPV